jgi:hypothetical protein
VTLAPGASTARTLELERAETVVRGPRGIGTLPPGRYVANGEMEGSVSRPAAAGQSAGAPRVRSYCRRAQRAPSWLYHLMAPYRDEPWRAWFSYMMIRRFLSPIALALSMMTGCNADRGIASDDALAVEASISDASIGSAETATITYRIRNDGRFPRTVAVSCMPELRIDDDRGVNVFPASVGFICIAMHTPPATLTAGEELIRTFTVGGAAGTSAIKLPVGRYTAEAEFRVGTSQHSQQHQLRSPEVSFEVIP